MSLIWQGPREMAEARVYGQEGPDFPHVVDTPLISMGILGFGGQAVVERVTVAGTEFFAARKTYIVHSDKDPEAIHGEACAELHHMKKLSPHHHITTPVLAYCHDDKYHIIMTPVADGGSLASFHKKIRLHPEMLTLKDYKTLQHCFGCLTMTMTHIHKASIRYKDVKLENILVHQGELLFSDFGVAYDFSLSPDGCSTTEGYAGAQTWTYSAPEVHSGGGRNRKSDMFSLGVVLYKVLSLFEPQLAELQTLGFYSLKIEEMIAKIEQITSGGVRLIFPMAVYEVVIAMLMRDQTARICSTDALTKLKSHKELFCDHCWVELENMSEVNAQLRIDEI
jgi:serine/threonine protein kinase